MSKPLVLYLEGSIDARAGAEQIRERWPGARLVPIRADDFEGFEAQAFSADWVLGLDGGPLDCHVIDPTPDASIAMQMWRLLHPVCEPCRDTRRTHPHGDYSMCGICGGTETPRPHTWLRYLDDAVCERWEMPDSREVWEWMQITLEHAWQFIGLAKRFDLDEAVTIGSAILRARERDAGRVAELEAMLDSTADRCIHGEETADRLLAEREDYFRALVDHEHTAARLRAERDDYRRRWQDEQARNSDEANAVAREGNAQIVALTRERDDLARAVLDAEGRAAELRAGLARLGGWYLEAVQRGGYCPACMLGGVSLEHEDDCEAVALCEPEGVERG